MLGLMFFSGHVKGFKPRTEARKNGFEIPADDLERAKKFYSDIFGWQLADWPMQDGSVYVGARTVEVDEAFVPKEAGAINGGIVKRDQYIKTPQVTINVPSVDDYIEKVKAAGGSVIKPKQEIEGMGYFAYVTDSEGNLLGLWQDIK